MFTALDMARTVSLLLSSVLAAIVLLIQLLGSRPLSDTSLSFYLLQHGTLSSPFLHYQDEIWPLLYKSV